MCVVANARVQCLKYRGNTNSKHAAGITHVLSRSPPPCAQPARGLLPVGVFQKLPSQPRSSALVAPFTAPIPCHHAPCMALAVPHCSGSGCLALPGPEVYRHAALPALQALPYQSLPVPRPRWRPRFAEKLTLWSPQFCSADRLTSRRAVHVPQNQALEHTPFKMMQTHHHDGDDTPS